jgi:hypothetical protein
MGPSRRGPSPGTLAEGSTVGVRPHRTGCEVAGHNRGPEDLGEIPQKNAFSIYTFISKHRIISL